MEFFLPVQGPGAEGEASEAGYGAKLKQLGSREQAIWQALQSWEALARAWLEAVGYSYPSLMRMDVLEGLGLVRWAD